jgi:hypothetical protein
LAIWGLAVVVAAETGAYKAIYPLVLAPIIALGIVVRSRLRKAKLCERLTSEKCW